MIDRPIRFRWLALLLVTVAMVAMAGSLSGCSGLATDDSHNKASVPDHPPITYKGSGNRTLGPVMLARGNATITVSGDAQYYPVRGAYPWDVEFSYMIANSTTGEWATDELAMIADNQSIDDAQSIYTRSVVYDVRAPGDYLIKIRAKNETVRWKMAISQ